MTSSLLRFGPFRAFSEIRRDYPPLVPVLAAGDLVASFGFSLIFPFLTLYLTEHLGASAGEAGLVLAGYSVCSIVSGAAGGWLADRVGRRSVMLTSVTLTGAIVVLMGQAPSLVAIGVLVVALGLVDPAFPPAARAAIADVVPEERRPRAYSLLAVAAAVGWIAGPGIGAGLAGLGYGLLFTVAGILIAAYAVIGVIWMPETLPGRRAGPLVARRDEPMLPPPGAALEAAAERLAADVAAGSRAPKTGPDGEEGTAATGAARGTDSRLVFAAFLPITAVVHAAVFQWVSILPIHAARDLGVPTTTWGLLFSINGLLIVLFQMRLTTIAERFPKPVVMAAATVFYAAGSLVTVFAATADVAVAGLATTIVLVTLGEILLFPQEPAFVSDLSPAHQRGRYQGLALAAAGVGSAAGPPLGGLCLDLVPGPLVWLLTAAAFLVCGLGLLALTRVAGDVRLPAVTGTGDVP